MDRNPVQPGRWTLEETYLRRIEKERLRSRSEETDPRAEREKLGAELEIGDTILLDDLLRLEITHETAPAFEALPLVEVAWADGEIDAEERWRVLCVATAFGLELGRAAHAQLELWLTRRPSKDLFDAWVRVAEARRGKPEMAARERRLLEGALEVAEAAGGWLGFGAVSGAERASITRLHQALGQPSTAPS